MSDHAISERTAAAADPSCWFPFDRPPTGIDPAEFVEYLRLERRSSRNTELAYKRAILEFAIWVRGGGMADYLRPVHGELGRFVECLHKRGLAPESIKLKLSAVKVYYRFLHLRERVTASALALVLSTEGPKSWERLPAVLNVKQIADLVEAPDSADRYQLRDRALLEVLYATGCRVSEIVNLTLADLHIEQRCANVIGKGNKQRVVMLNRPAVEALAAYLDDLRPRLGRSVPDAPWIFVNRSGRQLTRLDVWNLVKKYARRLRLAGRVSPHTLRHSLATHLTIGGADHRVVQDLLGHATIALTQKYVHVEAGRLWQLHRTHHPRGSTPPDAA